MSSGWEHVTDADVTHAMVEYMFERDEARADLAATRARLAEITGALEYAMKCGCLFDDTADPGPGASLETLKRWGAMRRLHDVFARERAKEQR